MKSLKVFASLFVLFFGLISCEEEDLKLKAQLDQQALEIQSKEAELAMVRKNVAKLKIDDPTEELAELAVEVDQAEALAAEAAEEVEQLKATQKKLEKDFEGYKNSYPMRD